MSSNVPIGLRDVYYALLLTDPAGGPATYDTPVRVIGAITANINPNPSMETLFADDGPMEVATSLGQIELELSSAGLDLDIQAALLGHTVTSGVMTRKSTDVPPWVALGFRSLKSTGAYRYVWLAKGKFSEIEQAHETKGDSVNFQPPTIRANFVKRDADDIWILETDGDHTDYVADTGTNWFNAVGSGAGDTTPPTVTVAPADTDIDVAVTADIVWTFSEAIKVSTITAANFFLYEASGYTLVAGALTYSSDREVVTFNPTSSLTAATEYVAVATTGVQDAAGNALATPEIAAFTTAA